MLQGIVGFDLNISFYRKIAGGIARNIDIFPGYCFIDYKIKNAYAFRLNENSAVVWATDGKIAIIEITGRAIIKVD